MIVRDDGYTTKSSISTAESTPTTQKTSTTEKSSNNSQPSTVDVSSLLDEKNKYVILKSNVNDIVKYLNSAINNLEIPANKIESLFLVDDLPIDSSKLMEIRQNLIQKKNELNNLVLPEIENKIKEIKESIG